MKKLEHNLIDNILEAEVKLGRASTSITFYYPESSLTELLGCRADELPAEIAEFIENVKERLGKITIEELANEKGRYAVKVPSEGLDWVQANFRPSDFMKDFIGEIQRPYNTLEGITEIFHKFSSDVIIDKVSENEWAFSFADEGIDPYVYHVEQNVFGLEYHRFTREAYAKMMAS